MQKGIYKYRTDTRRYKRELHKEEAKLLDYKMHLVIRFVLFLKYLITFRMQDAKGEPYMCTSDLTTWIGIDGDWYRVYVPSVVLGWPGILELAETEEELLDYLKDVSEFTRDEKGNN